MATPQTFKLHSEASLDAKANALCDEARVAHDRAWAAHRTAELVHQQSERLTEQAEAFRQNASWHETRPPRQREYVEWPIGSGVRIPIHQYLRTVADEHDAAARLTAARAHEHHEEGHAHMERGHDHDRPHRLAIQKEQEANEVRDADPAPAAVVVEEAERREVVGDTTEAEEQPHKRAPRAKLES